MSESTYELYKRLSDARRKAEDEAISNNDLKVLAQRLREYVGNPHHIDPLSDAFVSLVEQAATALSELAAPVVERQEPVCYQARHSESEPWFFTDKPGYWEWRPLFASPPAPVAEQHPIAYMRNEGTPNNLVKCSFSCPGAFGVYRGPVSLSAMPAPVAVVLPGYCTDLRYHPEFKRGFDTCLDKVKELNQ